MQNDWNLDSREEQNTNIDSKTNIILSLGFDIDKCTNLYNQLSNPWIY